MPQWRLPDGLPPGHLIVPDPEYLSHFGMAPTTEPALWVSDDGVPDAGPAWARLLTAHPGTGLWPLLLTGLAPPPDPAARRPWQAGELAPVPAGQITGLDAAQILAARWADMAAFPADDAPGAGAEPELYGPWPGLADPAAAGADPGQAAAALASAPGGVPELTGGGDLPYLGLVTAPDGASAINACGWTGTENSNGEIASVVSSWQQRFGAVVCALGFDTLGLSVAWRPASPGQARYVAAEHFAFCPDLAEITGIAEYARSLIRASVWRFWWD